MTFSQKEYMKEYSKRPYVKEKVKLYQKWFYSCTDVGIKSKKLSALKYDLKKLKNENFRFNHLIKIAFADIDYQQTILSCGGIRGRKSNEHY
jgi:hypothetical protein